MNSVIWALAIRLGIGLINWLGSQTKIITGPFSKKLNDLYEDALLTAKCSNNSTYQPITHLIQGDGHMRVRLLELQPGSGNQPVACTLSIVDLERSHAQSYEAISYVWGTSPWTSSIRINGKRFVISTVLHRLLLHLRRELTPRVLWIDALCINQFDLPERNSQVLQMPRIYSNAARVIVWLSHEEPWGLCNTFQYIDTFYQDATSNRRVDEEAHYGTSRVVAQLLRNDYWTRVWVIQEVVLAKRVIVQCGSSVLEWDRFCCLVRASTRRSFFPARSTHVNEFEDSDGFRKARLAPGNDYKPVSRSFRRMRNTITQPDDHSMSILSLCYSFRFRKSTEPRDKVFALIGLSNHPGSLLKVDYSRRKSFLSIDLSTQQAHHSRNLSVVALAEMTRQHSKKACPAGRNPDYIPTWCPSFFNGAGGFDRSLRLFWTGLSGEENSFSATGHVPIFLAPMHEETQSEALADHSSFHLLKIHVLSDFSAKITHDNRSDDFEDEALNKTLRIDETLHATLRSMNGQIMPGERILSEEVIRLRTASLAPSANYTRALFDQDMSALELLHLTLTAGKFSKYPLSDSAASRKYHEARRQSCSQRRLFVTSSGHLGLGPESLQKSDELHLVLGMDVPVILRPATSEWKEKLDEPYRSGWIYVGQAYVHEMMRYEGDLVADIDCGRVKIEERVLV